MSDGIDHCVPLIRDHFQLAEQELSSIDSHDALEKELTRIIRYMLDQDFNRLLNALYKIDLREEKFKEIISLHPAENIARELAREVIQRELQKVETRRKYKNQ